MPCGGRARAARKAELLLAAGYRPGTYSQLVYVRVVEEGAPGLEEEEEEEGDDVVVHLQNFYTVGRPGVKGACAGCAPAPRQQVGACLRHGCDMLVVCWCCPSAPILAG